MCLHSAATIAVMTSDEKIDYQREAVAAMKMAVSTSGFERMKWVRLAQAWQDLGRGRDSGVDSGGQLKSAAPVPPLRR